MPRDRSLDEFSTVESETGADDDATVSDADREGSAADVTEVAGDGTADAGRPSTAGDGAAGAAVDETDTEPASRRDDPDVEPLSTTFAWSPAEHPCASCGEPARARWRDDGGLVCRDCKTW